MPHVARCRVAQRHHTRSASRRRSPLSASVAGEAPLQPRQTRSKYATETQSGRGTINVVAYTGIGSVENDAYPIILTHGWRCKRSVKRVVGGKEITDTTGVEMSYLNEMMGRLKGAVQRGAIQVFALVANHLESLEVAGFLVGYSRRGPGPGRVEAVLDVICTQAIDTERVVKGAGTVLLAELEKYAKHVLGAQQIVLHSVIDPLTVKAYQRTGYSRTLDACAAPRDAAAANVAARKTYKNHADAMVAARPAGDKRNYSLWKATLDGRLFRGPDQNDAPDTVVMAKCIQGAKPPQVSGPGAAFAVWKKGGHGKLYTNNV